MAHKAYQAHLIIARLRHLAPALGVDHLPPLTPLTAVAVAFYSSFVHVATPTRIGSSCITDRVGRDRAVLVSRRRSAPAFHDAYLVHLEIRDALRASLRIPLRPCGVARSPIAIHRVHRRNADRYDDDKVNGNDETVTHRESRRTIAHRDR